MYGNNNNRPNQHRQHPQRPHPQGNHPQGNRPQRNHREHEDYSRGNMSYRQEDSRDFFTPGGRDIYVEDENISGRITPMGYDYRNDEYGYEYTPLGPNWGYDSNNDYGTLSPDRVWDYGGHGASGYAGPYWGRPVNFARRENAIYDPYPGKYGREQVYPMNFGPTRPHWPQDNYHDNRSSNQYSERNRGQAPWPQDNYHDPRSGSYSSQSNRIPYSQSERNHQLAMDRNYYPDSHRNNYSDDRNEPQPRQRTHFRRPPERY